MRTVAIVAVAWFAVSVLFAIGWARFHRLMYDRMVVAEAERIITEASDRAFGGRS